MNKYAFIMFGYSQADMDNGLNILELLIEEDRPLSKTRIQKVLEGQVTGDEYTATAHRHD